MAKHLLTALLLLVLGLATQAQTFRSGGALPQPAPATTQSAGPAREAGSINFTYFEGEFTGSNYDVFGLGQAKVGLTYDVAMYVPANYAGYRVTDVKFALYDATILSDVKAWVAEELPTSASSADVCTSLADTPKSYNEGLNTVQLSSEYVIPDSGCYVGYSFTLTSATSELRYAAEYPVLTDKSTANAGGLYMKASAGYTQWMHSFKTMGYGFSSTIVAVLKGDFSNNEAYLTSQDLGTKTTVVGEKKTFDVKFTSYSVTPVTSLTYTVTDVATGQVSDERTVSDLGGIEYTKTATFPMELDAEQAVGDYEKQVTITKVNGAENTNEARTGTFTVHALSTALNKKVFEEEFTTTDCGWCPMGIVGLELCRQTYPDNWVGVAIHGLTGTGYWDDPMYNEDYANMPGDLKSMNYPSAQLDRSQFNLSPYYGASKTTDKPADILNDVNSHLVDLPDASVKVSAQWADGLGAINVSTTTDFAFDYKDSPFALGFILVGNGLKGESELWYQYNYYHSYGEQYASDSNLAPWIEKDARVTDMEYNHVALLTLGLVDGVEGSVASPVKAGQQQTFTTQFDLSAGQILSTTDEGTDLLQNPDQMQVIAFIVNTETLQVVNCDECDVTGYATAIRGAVSDMHAATSTARYNAAGQQLSTDAPGLTIVRMSDGSVRKVLR